jgi:hypothetical protein
MIVASPASPPEQEQLVSVLSRQWIVTEVAPSTLPPERLQTGLEIPQHLLTLPSVEDDGLGEEIIAIWELEPGARVVEKVALPEPTGFDPPLQLDAFLDAVRLGNGGPMSYKADITAGALKVPESRIIADLLLRGVDAEGWKTSSLRQNVLQARNPATASRLTKLIRGRLEAMGPDLWKLVRDGKGIVATHAVFAAAVKHSQLLGDFLQLVVGEQYRLFGQSLSYKLWDDYLEGCRERDPDMPQWNETTRRRLRSSVFQTLAQAGYIENTRSLNLQTVHIAEQVLRYLKAHHEDYVLRCIQVSP